MYPFRNKTNFYGEKLLAPRLTPNWRTTPCRLSATLVHCIRTYPPYWRSFFDPQSDDAPCLVYKDNLSWVSTDFV